jgi:hypothetical protein
MHVVNCACVSGAGASLATASNNVKRVIKDEANEANGAQKRRQHQQKYFLSAVYKRCVKC